MRTCYFLLAAAATALPAVRADEPHLDLIRGLRAQGEPGLAMEYIQTRLGSPPPAIAVVLPLELARTRVELALLEQEDGKRQGMLNQARAEFDAFLKANPNHPLAAQAGFEIARLTAAQARDQADRARRTDDKEAQRKGFAAARPLFQDAAVKLQQAAKVLGAQVTALQNATTAEERATARELQQAFLQAGLEEGIAHYQLAQTFTLDSESGQRGEAMEKAIKRLERVVAEDARHPTCWLARAWLGRCHANNQDFPKAKTEFAAVMSERGPHADAAHRVTEFFQMLMQQDEGQTPPARLDANATAWLVRYSSYLNTPEGYGVRYFLASLLERQAAAGIRRDPKTNRPVSVTADAEAKLSRAEKLLRELTETENEYTDRAARKRLGVILALALRRAPDRDPAKLTSFEGCFMIAQLEIAELSEDLREAKDDDPDRLAETRKVRFAKVVKALDRALTVVKPTDPPREVLEAKYLQVYANLMVGQNARAAELGEALARSQTRTSRGAIAARYALEAHRNLLTELRAGGDVREEDLKTAKDHIRRIAKFMEDTWPTDPPTDAARHQLGALLAADGEHVEALKAYARVTPAYAALANVRYEQGVACFRLQQARGASPAERADWFARVTAELEKMPDLGAGADGDTAYLYCLARLQLGNLLQQAGGQYPKVEQIARSVLDALPKYGTMSEKNRTDVRQQATTLRYYGLYGQVYEAVRKGDHATAAKLYQPAIDELKKSGPPPEDAVRVRAALASLLQLALRSSVQEGVIDRAQDILKHLETVSTSGGSSGPLVQVLREVQLQINDLKKHNPEQLKATVDRFSSFLEDLAKAPKISDDVRIFLAQGFASLDKPARAVELLSAIKEPPDAGPPPAEPKEGASDQERANYEAAKAKYDAAAGARRTYNFVQLAHVRALRQLGRESGDPKSAHFAAAEALLQKMIGTPQNKGWAFSNLEVRRESIFLMEDRGQYKEAMASWRATQQPFVKQLVIPPQNQQQQRIRQIVYEYHFYQVRCMYLSKVHSPALQKDPKRKEEEYRKVAKNVVGVEKNAQTADFGGAEVRRLYKELIDGDDELKKAYVAEGGTALLGEGDGRSAGTP